jgi:hypothetical protein
MGQMMSNLAMTAGRLDSGEVWDLEDHEALEAARKLIRQYSDVRLTVVGLAEQVKS